MYNSVLETGLEIMEELDGNGIKQKGGEQYDLRLCQVTIRGFGPFSQLVTYPLDNRGLVLLRGEYKRWSNS